MKNTMKRTLGLFAAALLTMSLALSVYASGHDLTFTDKGNRMHVKDKTVHVNIWTIPALMTTLFWTMQRNIWSMISSSCTVVSGPIPHGR